ncbi:Putative branched-chain amino acid transporter substrate-binding protein [plant metagenome]|uniref:Branched-chain amino acid transporter substrate-binding protein n=2 Tax=plant metagenome TaxID=1297885 RepID=A0A484TT06_9ZZZZ
MHHLMGFSAASARRLWRAVVGGALACLAATASFPSLAEKPLRIGAPLALSGGLAEEGKKQQVAYQLWLERIQAQGGIMIGSAKVPVELVTYDYQSDEKRAQQLAERLITQDRVDFMTAPFGSGHAKVVAGVAERYGVPVIAVASSEPVHNQGYKHLFGTLAPSVGLIDTMIEYFTAQRPGTGTIAVLGRDDVFPKVMATTMSRQAAKAGLKVVYDTLYPVGTMDFSAALTAIKAARPDWIYVTGYTSDLILARKQMADLGVDAPILTMVTGPAYPEFVDGLGPLAENVTSATWWHASQTYSSDDVFGGTQAFAQAVRDRTGKDPDYVHASSAAALVVLQKAVEAAGTRDRAKVRDALAGLDVMTFYGPVKFREDGMNMNRELPIIQIHDGNPVVLFPVPAQASALRLSAK